MIAIIDYEVGNLRNVEKALEAAGGKPIVTSDVDMIKKADAIVLPGVGAFEEAMKKLTASGTVDVIRSAIQQNKPFLGICLGMQMLFEYSEEGKENVQGLGIFSGWVKKFLPTAAALKIPQIGWNSIQKSTASKLLEGIREDEYFYFVHSYYVESRDRNIVAATAEYGTVFDAVIGSGNVFATQFHPEKSGNAGLKLLGNFIRLANERKESEQ